MCVCVCVCVCVCACERLHRFVHSLAVNRAVESVAHAVRAVDDRDAAILTATKQRLGSEVLAAGEELAKVQKGLRQLQEKAQATESARKAVATALDREAVRAVEELAAAVEAASKLRTKVLNRTAVEEAGNGMERRPSGAAVTDVSAFSDAERFVESVRSRRGRVVCVCEVWCVVCGVCAPRA